MHMRRKFSIRSLLAITFVAASCVSFWIWAHPSYVVVEIPGPNSQTFSTSEATKLLPEFLNKTAGIDRNHEIIKNWKGRTQSVHVHVDKNGQISSTCVGFEDLLGGPLAEWGATRLGLDGLESSMWTEPRMGNELSVLITSDTDKWAGTEKQQVIDMLFEPGVQIYSVQFKRRITK